MTPVEASGPAVAETEKMVGEMLGGSVRALSKLMTRVETSAGLVPAIMKEIYSRRKPARRIGISGPPGAGKSTLLANLIHDAAAKDQRVGVLCIDPTSPITGGALLGDRIRMGGTHELKNVFIRSVASGRSLGGLAEATKYHTLLLEAFGMDIVLIETVGLGQVGYDIRNVAESLVLVLVPESGDTVQILKSGIIEMADIVVVNKADRDGAEEIAQTLRHTFAHPRDGWKIPVVKCVAREDEGTGELWSALDDHFEFLKSNDLLDAYRNPRNDLREAVEFGFQRLLREGLVEKNPDLAEMAAQVAGERADPYSAAENILKILFKGDPHGRQEQAPEPGVRDTAAPHGNIKK